MGADEYSLLERKFRAVPQIEDGDSTTPSKVFSLLQFNMLADSLCESGGFVKSPQGCLPWGARQEPLLQEVAQHDPDIICMQECDKYEEWFLPQLQARGYSGVFQKKKDPSLDGCAVFWRRSRFTLAEDTLQQFHLRDGDSQVGIILVLEPVVSGSGDGGEKESGVEGRGNIPPPRLLLATTHLKATKTQEGEDMRTNQITYLLDRLQSTSSSLTSPHAVLLAGDLNASPTGGKYPAQVYPTVMSHPLDLQSAYANTHQDRQGAQGEPEFTTFKIRGESGWNGGAGGVAKHTIDFIFHSKDTLRPISLLQIPTEEEIGENGVPSFKYPSDHFALMAEFGVVQSSEER